MLAAGPDTYDLSPGQTSFRDLNFLIDTHDLHPNQRAAA